MLSDVFRFIGPRLMKFNMKDCLFYPFPLFFPAFQLSIIVTRHDFPYLRLSSSSFFPFSLLGFDFVITSVEVERNQKVVSGKL
jgi:hypothetical protein